MPRGEFPHGRASGSHPKGRSAAQETPASAGVDGLWSSRARGKRTPSGARAFKGLLIYMLCPPRVAAWSWGTKVDRLRRSFAPSPRSGGARSGARNRDDLR